MWQRSFPAGKFLTKLSVVAFFLEMAAAQETRAPFPVTSVVNEPTIAGRAVTLDDQHKLLPWPMPDHTGYSYSG